MNDKPVCEQAHLCEFRIVLAVEAPGLAGRKKVMGKSEPEDQFLFFSPLNLSGVKVLSNRGKAKCKQK